MRVRSTCTALTILRGAKRGGEQGGRGVSRQAGEAASPRWVAAGALLAQLLGLKRSSLCAAPPGPAYRRRSEGTHRPTMPGTSLARACSFFFWSVIDQPLLVMSLAPIRITATRGCACVRVGGCWSVDCGLLGGWLGGYSRLRCGRAGDAGGSGAAASGGVCGAPCSRSGCGRSAGGTAGARSRPWTCPSRPACTCQSAWPAPAARPRSSTAARTAPRRCSRGTCPCP